MTTTNTSTSSAPMRTGTPNSICNAIAPPRISASEVEIDASTAEPSKGRDHAGLRYADAASDRQRPVAMPRCATLCCNTISITVESVTIHSSVYPYCAPAARLEAQLPGSMNPTVTSSPGPMYLKISNPPIRGL